MFDLLINGDLTGEAKVGRPYHRFAEASAIASHFHSSAHQRGQACCIRRNWRFEGTCPQGIACHSLTCY